ncbi:carboxylating nicotinate-nucleotide diphosphorylase [Tatumella citrea]|uniref:nicotinate-nucleotide diphosphorylase (carboxylating) n=1 Tax=Tatumella citrea TaxID=53336 RepID=A0A1Y0LMB6_TATCI|nr:carboxylating nicotinate-nucleotide diphosphorylase [Tatumella citrea]ARU95132.1 nicotinate-nucleotide diphosphorylase (carboxylating) [Tatumella citrea]ARU99172.1 nicotinate-nucleotide diphosphorylase (carboxylating) [Tatumella citrea]
MPISHYAAEHCRQLLLERIQTEIPESVQLALKNAHPASTLPGDRPGQAIIVCKEDGIFCGKAWADEIFSQLDTSITVQWQVNDSDAIQAGQTLAIVNGPAAALLVAESVVVNFLQNLSGVATQINKLVEQLNGSQTRLIDSLSSTPGTNSLKYALLMGTKQSACLDFSDMIPLRENHIIACGSVLEAIENARWIDPDRPVEIEVTSQQQLSEASSAGANFILLNGFTTAEITTAVDFVRKNAAQTHLEAGGNISGDDLDELVRTGIGYVSADALIRHQRPLSISLQFQAAAS